MDIVEFSETFEAGTSGNAIVFRVENTTAFPVEGLDLNCLGERDHAQEPIRSGRGRLDPLRLPTAHARVDRSLPVRFGRSRPTLDGRTANLSESGLFVATDSLLAGGVSLGLLLELEHCKVPLRGTVVWQRSQPSADLSSGMGMRLVNPPSVYLSYVRALA